MSPEFAEPLSPDEAKRLLRAVLATGEIAFTGHALDEMKRDGISGREVPFRGVCGRGDRLEVAAVSPQTRRRAVQASGPAIPCAECGESLRITRQPHRYTLTPKWAITIEDAEVRRCGKCGHFEVVIPRPEALHRAIAAEVIRKPARLSGPEMVFLRSQLGMTAKALAKAMGVVPESMSRWENDVLPVPPPVDRLLRTMVALTTEGEKFPVEKLAGIEGTAGPMRLVVTVDPKGGWRRAA